MPIKMSPIYTTLTLHLAAALFLFFHVQKLVHYLHGKATGHRRRRLPPGPTGWPILGALPLLGNMPHVTFANMAKKYGPVMYLKVGSHGLAIASTPDAAKAFLKTLDLNFSNRPPNAGATHLAYNAQDMVFAHYGPKWKLLRKLSNLHMLGGKALENWADVRKTELGYMLKTMFESSQNNEPVMISEMLTYAMANMISQVILSRRVFSNKGAKSNEFKDMVVELMTSAGYFNIGDFIPTIGWMDLQGIEGGMKRLHKKFDVLLTRLLDDHERASHERKQKPDFLDFVIANRDNSDGEKLNTDNIKALLLNLFTAGTDTSSSIIEWALAELLKNRTLLTRAQDEMDRVIGRDRRLLESDIPNLPYLQAICKETFRKHPSTPLNLPRIASEPCEVNGYYIPKGTRLNVNIWAIGRDPSVWGDNPNEFDPERFLYGKNAKIDPRGNDFELIPFGAGRRICAGTRMGILLVEYILGTLVHSFDWKLGFSEDELNMDETFGLALQKAVPLTAMVIPRLPLHVYAP